MDDESNDISISIHNLNNSSEKITVQYDDQAGSNEFLDPDNDRFRQSS